MGGKSSKSKSSVTVPPDVLARYNSVNQTAQTAANAPFTPYSSNPDAFVAPLNSTEQSGISNVNAAQGMAQPYYDQATNQVLGAQTAATPFYGQAANDLSGAQTVGDMLGAQSYGQTVGAQAAANPYNQAAGNAYSGAYAGAQPYNQAAESGINQAVSGANPYNQAATGLAAAGAQAVDPSQINAQSINQYLNPYLSTVLQGTAGLLNQNNQQQQAGQLGNAISSGAFGGDRAGIAAANLSQQQNLANSQIYSGILDQGYNNALSTAQQQQGVNLSAGQANRAALQNASNQFLGIGQQGYAQQMGAAQAQQGLGQQQYAQGMGLGTAQQGLGQQTYQQGMGTAQQLAALGQQQFGQGVTSAQAQQGLGAGLYGMGSTTANTLAGLGTQSQQAALSGAQAQLSAGQVAQQTQQAGDTALYNQFLQQQSYPFQTAQFLANIAEGTGALSGSTTTTTQPGGFFSDEKLKENIRPVGKTFDGQTIHAYNYKGDPRTQVGLIAQDVEKKHPDAVGEASGYKTVDYGKATDKAARRGHFADGGLAGFDPDVMSRVLGDQQKSFGQFGLSGLVPQAANDSAPAMSPQSAGGVFPAGSFSSGNGPSPFSAAFSNAYANAPDGMNKFGKVFSSIFKAGRDLHDQQKGKADGGLVGYDPDLMKQILSNQEGSFGPFGRAGLYGGSANLIPWGGSSYVPSANLSVGKLMTAAPVAPPPSTVEQINKLTDIAGKIKSGIGDAKSISAKMSKKDSPKDESENDNLGDNYATGGIAGQAPNDNSDDPIYDDKGVGPKLKIPNDNPNLKSNALSPPDADNKPDNGMSDITKSAMKIFPMIMSLSRGGYINHLAGGGAPDDIYDMDKSIPGLDIPNEHPGGNLKSAKSPDAPASQSSKLFNSGLSVANLVSEFADGGKIARHNFADGGSPDDDGILSSIGHLFGIGNAPNPGNFWQKNDGWTGAAIPSAKPASVEVALPPPVAARKPASVEVPLPPPARRHGLGVSPETVNHDPAGSPTADELNRAQLLRSQLGNISGTPTDANAGQGNLGSVAVPAGSGTNVPSVATSGPAAGLVAPSGDVGPVTDAYAGVTPTDRLNGILTAKSDTSGDDQKKHGHGLGNRILHPDGKPDLILPILQGIAAMGTAPTRSLGVALAAGLGAGANSYMSNQQQSARIAKTKAESGQIGALTKQTNYDVWKQQNPPPIIPGEGDAGWSVAPGPDKDGKSVIGPDGVTPVHWELSANAAGMHNAPGATPAQPTQPANAAPWGIGNNGAQTAQQAQGRYLMATPPDKVQSAALKSNMLDQYQASESFRPQLNKLASIVSSPDTGTLAPNFVTPFITPLVSTYNNVLARVLPDGASNPAYQKLAIDPSGMTSNQILEKMTISNAASGADAAGQKALGALEDRMKAAAGMGHDRATNISIAASMYQANQMPWLMKKYADNLDQTKGGLPGNYLMQDVVPAFNADHNTAQFEHDRHTIEGLLDKGFVYNGKQVPFTTLEKGLEAGGAQAKAAAKILDAAGGYPGFHTYFTGAE